MVTKWNLLLLVVTVAVAVQEESAAPAIPDVNVEALQLEGLLDGKRDKRNLLGFGTGLLLGKAVGRAGIQGQQYNGYQGIGGGYRYYPGSGDYNYYRPYRSQYSPYNYDYYEYPAGPYYGGGGGYGGGGYGGGGYGGTGARSQASATSISGGFGPFHAGFSKSDASAGAYG